MVQGEFNDYLIMFVFVSGMLSQVIRCLSCLVTWICLNELAPHITLETSLKQRTHPRTTYMIEGCHNWINTSQGFYMRKQHYLY